MTERCVCEFIGPDVLVNRELRCPVHPLNRSDGDPGRETRAAEMRFDAPADNPDVPRPARLIGPRDLGLNSRIDVYLHDGADSNGDEYASRVTLHLDEAMIRRGAKALALQEGWRRHELDEGSDCWLLHAEVCIRAALSAPDDEVVETTDA